MWLDLYVIKNPMITGCTLISRLSFFVTTHIYEAEEYPKFFPSMFKASLYSLIISINWSL